VAPPARNAATSRSVPLPVTPPKTTAEMGAEITAAAIPITSPAATAYTAPRSRRSSNPHPIRTTNATIATMKKSRDCSKNAGSKKVVSVNRVGSANARL
jgi:hypothetical protein